MATYISALIHSVQFLGPGPIVRLVLGLKTHELDLTHSPLSLVNGETCWKLVSDEPTLLQNGL